MNREIVENILGVLKTSTDKNVIVKGLLKLRTDIVKDRDGIILFRVAGGVSPMIRFLNKPYEQILAVALSILGNCCTDNLSCKEALGCKIAVPLATILKSIPNPLIQCRACRLLGNLAKCDSNLLLATHCPAIAQSVCQIIEETNNVETRIMAVRACRFMLGNPQFLKFFLQANGFTIILRIFAVVMKNEDQEELLDDINSMPVLGLKKNQHREKYFEEVARNLEGVRSDIFDHEVLKNSTKRSHAYAMPKENADLDLTFEILKCLLAISELQMSFRVWEALTSNRCSFDPIVFFVSEENKYRSVALKIVSNFSKNAGALHALSTADAIVAACELLVIENSDKPLSESETRHCINIIYMLSSDACNRSKIRRSGVLRKLIAMIRESKSESITALVLFLFNNFQYDNMSMDLMLREGLLPVLIAELDAYLTSNDEYRKKKREERQQATKKRKLSEKSLEPVCKFAKRREESNFDYDSPSSSPHSYAAPSSPCSSRSMSPVGSSPFKLHCNADSDSETYSPVCSDDEGDDEDDVNNTIPEINNASSDAVPPRTQNLDNSEIMRLLDIACRNEAIEDKILDKEDDEDISQDFPVTKVPTLGNMPRSIIDIIENLLYRITLLVDKRGELGKPETMHTLIKAINLFGANNNFSGSLTNILIESQFFVHVIKHGIAHQLYQMTKVEEMRKDGFGFIDILTNVGQSNYGQAELARLLRTDDALSQKRAAIAVAYIIKSHRLLYQFLNDGNALTVLLDIILSSKRDEFTAEAVDALTSMSKYTLSILVPQLDVVNEEFVEDTKPMHSNCDMRFVVHDKGGDDIKVPPVFIGFNKQLLCDTSEVFNTMLNSDFREGNEGEIHLKSYTVSGLKYFLNLILRESQKLDANVPPTVKHNAVLEAFEMSRVYIMPRMEKLVLQLLIALLDENNCQSVLEWSMKNYHAELTEMAINYYLCSMLSTDAKVKLFHNADYSMYSTEWFQMIIDSVFVRCRNGF